MATPFAAQMGLPVLLAARACMGIGEGVAMPAMNNLLSRCFARKIFLIAYEGVLYKNRVRLLVMK